ncbi:hypothetical protein ACFJIV_20440 [Mucilaginibacter sp. UC70_90]
MNILIKLMSIVSLVIAPHLNSHPAATSARIKKEMNKQPMSIHVVVKAEKSV